MDRRAKTLLAMAGGCVVLFALGAYEMVLFRGVSPALWGGILVAMPTAIPLAPLTNKVG